MTRFKKLPTLNEEGHRINYSADINEAQALFDIQEKYETNDPKIIAKMKKLGYRVYK
jgi:hypothetical protein